jgi:hypothetical protein
MAHPGPGVYGNQDGFLLRRLSVSHMGDMTLPFDPESWMRRRTSKDMGFSTSPSHAGMGRRPSLFRELEQSGVHLSEPLPSFIDGHGPHQSEASTLAANSKDGKDDTSADVSASSMRAPPMVVSDRRHSMSMNWGGSIGTPSNFVNMHGAPGMQAMQGMNMNMNMGMGVYGMPPQVQVPDRSMSSGVFQNGYIPTPSPGTTSHSVHTQMPFSASSMQGHSHAHPMAMMASMYGPPGLQMASAMVNTSHAPAPTPDSPMSDATWSSPSMPHLARFAMLSKTGRTTFHPWSKPIDDNHPEDSEWYKTSVYTLCMRIELQLDYPDDELEAHVDLVHHIDLTPIADGLTMHREAPFKIKKRSFACFQGRIGPFAPQKFSFVHNGKHAPFRLRVRIRCPSLAGVEFSTISPPFMVKSKKPKDRQTAQEPIKDRKRQRTDQQAQALDDAFDRAASPHTTRSGDSDRAFGVSFSTANLPVDEAAKLFEVMSSNKRSRRS